MKLTLFPSPHKHLLNTFEGRFSGYLWVYSWHFWSFACYLRFRNYRTIALISHASKVFLKILQARLQQYVNRELPDVQTGFRKDRGTRGQIVNIHWIIEKAREFQENIYFCFIDYTKIFDCVDHNKLWKILKVMGKPEHLTYLLRNLIQVKKQR